MSHHTKIVLTPEQRRLLEQSIHAGSAPARVQTRARILLLSDRSQGTTRNDADVASALLCSLGTVVNVRRRFVSEGLEAALSERPRPGQKPKITGEVEAKLVALACSAPPEGRKQWTLQLLADKLVSLQLVESISDTTIGDRLKKTRSNPGK